jgi:hypothetical protein
MKSQGTTTVATSTLASPSRAGRHCCLAAEDLR